jgi:HD-GYP domain-containing protein (c-di-GMP phosphodiesterase class II)
MEVKDLDELLSIGEALLTEKEIDKLLDMILQKSRHLLSADAGSIFLAEGPTPDQPTHLRFKLAQNDSVEIKYKEFLLPITPRNLAGYVAATKNTIRFDDVYLIPDGLPFGFSKEIDQKTGYRSKSILSVSMTDHRGNLIGVVQLWNKKKDRHTKLAKENTADQVISFTEFDQKLLLSLASQVGIAIENTRLYEEINRLFEGFIRASVQAIEARDPTTSGHSERVAKYTLGLADVVHKTEAGLYRNQSFTEQQLRELKYAALLHDFGKIGVRESVLVKAKKFYPEEYSVAVAQFELLRRTIEMEAAEKKLSHLRNGGKEGDEEWNRIRSDSERRLKEAKAAYEVFIVSNEPTVLPEHASDQLRDLEKLNIFTPEQIVRLSVPKGSLSDKERMEIESHVTYTYRFLERIPWTRDLKEVPTIAYAHHEKLDGSGYPRKLLSAEIPVQSKIMAVVDIYDALTASDRPYKKAIAVQKALDILQMEVKEKKLDEELVRLFIESKAYEITIQPA